MNGSSHTDIVRLLRYEAGLPEGNRPSEIYVLISAPGLFSMKIFSLWQQVVDKFNYQKFFILPELHKFADTSK
jgi:hypothetical protein